MMSEVEWGQKSWVEQLTCAFEKDHLPLNHHDETHLGKTKSLIFPKLSDFCFFWNQTCHCFQSGPCFNASPHISRAVTCDWWRITPQILQIPFKLSFNIWKKGPLLQGGDPVVPFWEQARGIMNLFEEVERFPHVPNLSQIENLLLPKKQSRCFQTEETWSTH